MRAPLGQSPGVATIVQAFERVVAKHPEHIAVSWAIGENVGELNYAQLDQQSAQVAHRLLDLGLLPGEIVGVWGEAEGDWVVALLGVLRAGAAYLPISSDPPARVRQLLADARVRIGLTVGAPTEGAEFDQVEFWSLSQLRQGEVLPKTGPKLTPENPAYVMYTSGSSGVPKGVMVSHQNVLRLVLGADYIEFSDQMRVLLTGAVSFDATTFELWAPLLNGGTVFLASPAQIQNPVELSKLLQQWKITTLWLTSALFSRLAQANSLLFAGLTDLMVGGDVVSAAAVRNVLVVSPELRITNGYGPTENTTFSTTHHITLADTAGAIPIGTPITGSTAYVLDADRQELPAGAAGELWVGGDGVALGYLGQPELTAERFVPDHIRGHGRMYRTGDRVRRRPDGVLEFIGRIDDQLKINGFRIEPGEISATLLGHPQISEAVVVVHTKGDRKYLVGYVVSPLSTAEIRRYLAAQLPRYLIPAFLVALPQFPLTAHGKVDRAALPEPQCQCEVEYRPARNEFERLLIEAWEPLLQATLGALDSIYDHAVDSLTAVTLASAATKSTARLITVGDVFGYPSIEELAEFAAQAPLASHEIAQLASDSPTTPNEFPLSAAQTAIYLQQLQQEDSLRYNIPLLLELSPEVDSEQMRAAWAQVVAHHPALRTGFRVDQTPLQTITQTAGVLEFRSGAPVIPDLIRPFQLAEPPLARAVLLRDEGRCWLFVDLHHVVVDGLSVQRIFADLAAAYRGEPLADPGLNGYSLAQLIAQDEKKPEDLSYWSTVFAGWRRPAEPPTDRPRSLHPKHAGSVHAQKLSPEQAAGLRSLASSHNNTLFTTILTAFSVFLGGISREEEVCIGVPTTGRNRPEFESVVGMLVNPMPLRLLVPADQSFIQLLNSTAQQSRTAIEHSSFPLFELGRMVEPQRDPGQNPLFDVLLAVQSSSMLELKFLDHPVVLKPLFTGQSMFELNVQVYLSATGIDIDWEYSRQRYDRQTISSFAELFSQLIDGILANPQATFSQLAHTEQTISPSSPLEFEL